MIWLRIEGSPVLQIIRNADALAMVDPKVATHAILLSAGTLRSGGEENASLSVTLQNAGMEASALFAARPPIGVAAVLMRDDAELFRGVVAGINLTGAEASIEIEA